MSVRGKCLHPPEPRVVVYAVHHNSTSNAMVRGASKRCVALHATTGLGRVAGLGAHNGVNSEGGFQWRMWAMLVV
jgi:hypothetical protein